MQPSLLSVVGWWLIEVTVWCDVMGNPPVILVYPYPLSRVQFSHGCGCGWTQIYPLGHGIPVTSTTGIELESNGVRKGAVPPPLCRWQGSPTVLVKSMTTVLFWPYVQGVWQMMPHVHLIGCSDRDITGDRTWHMFIRGDNNQSENGIAEKCK